MICMIILQDHSVSCRKPKYLCCSSVIPSSDTRSRNFGNSLGLVSPGVCSLVSVLTVAQSLVAKGDAQGYKGHRCRGSVQDRMPPSISESCAPKLSWGGGGVQETLAPCVDGHSSNSHCQACAHRRVEGAPSHRCMRARAVTRAASPLKGCKANGLEMSDMIYIGDLGT